MKRYILLSVGVFVALSLNAKDVAKSVHNIVKGKSEKVDPFAINVSFEDLEKAEEENKRAKEESKRLGSWKEIKEANKRAKEENKKAHRLDDIATKLVVVGGMDNQEKNVTKK